MSQTKKTLLGGAMASLVLSLVIPVTSGTGTSAVPSAEAGIRPSFSKPWRTESKRSSNPDFKPVKSYPLPDHLQEGGEGSAPGALSGPPAGMTAEEYADEAEVVADEPEKKSGNPISRLFDRITGRGDRRSEKMSQPGRLQDEDAQQPEVFFEVDSDIPLVELPPAQPAPQASAPQAIPMPVPVESGALADIIIPPQPRPMLLPGMEEAPPEMLREELTTGLKAIETQDPFPLPPLPDGYKSNEPAATMAQTPTKTTPEETATPAVEDNFAATLDSLLPPLPAPALEAEETKTAQIQPRRLTSEPESVSESAPSDEEAPGFARASVPAPRELAAEMAIELPENSAVSSLESQPMTSQNQTEEEWNGSKPKGELANNLPLAPSTNEVLAAKEREMEREQAQQSRQEITVEEEPKTYKGWRPRETHSAHQEPNTLNIPDSARPAELPTHATVHHQEQAEKYRRISERGERTGFKGFCPVALKDHLELVDAFPEYRDEFEGQVYYFCSQECLALFKADPIRYVPAQGGIDLVEYLEEGKEKAGRLDFAVWYQDRLFLFASQETLEAFRSEPGRFIGEE